MNPVLNVSSLPLFFGKEARPVPIGLTIWCDPSSGSDFFDIDRCHYIDSLDCELISGVDTPFDFIKLEYQWIERLRKLAGRSTYREIFNCIAGALQHIDGVVVVSPNRESGDNISYLWSQIGETGA